MPYLSLLIQTHVITTLSVFIRAIKTTIKSKISVSNNCALTSHGSVPQSLLSAPIQVSLNRCVSFLKGGGASARCGCVTHNNNNRIVEWFTFISGTRSAWIWKPLTVLPFNRIRTEANIYSWCRHVFMLGCWTYVALVWSENAGKQIL